MLVIIEKTILYQKFTSDDNSARLFGKIAICINNPIISNFDLLWSKPEITECKFVEHFRIGLPSKSYFFNATNILASLVKDVVLNLCVYFLKHELPDISEPFITPVANTC